MTTIRLSLVFLVLGLSILLGLWAMGFVGGPEVSDAASRTLAIVAVGGVASSLVLALLGARRPPAAGDDSNPPRNGPRF
jgi:hypothetical protein